MGVLHATAVRGKEVFSFDYDPSWLENPAARGLDPELQLLTGPQYASRINFGVFLDSTPDRWGRVLMQRREVVRARREKRSVRTLLESDYLLGVHDSQRPGALRFRMDGAFLDDDNGMAAPPWTELANLEHASLALENADNAKRSDAERWLELLIAPGSSLGGARPKASVLDSKGQLWIAKFPSTRDEHDVGAWQHVLHRLGARAGLSVAESRVEQFRSTQHTFLTRRFDRAPTGERIHYCSALTLVGRKDGDDAEAGASYLELAEILARAGADPRRDANELWSRILFHVLVRNTDDHLRNHGFLLTPTGWTLSPAFDLNPNPAGAGLALNIDEADNSLSLELVRSVAKHFLVKDDDVAPRIERMCAVVARWKAEAKTLGISRDEQERMAPAFAAASA